MTINPTLSIIYGELVLSLYPILIKNVNTNLFTQTIARFLVFPVLALVFGTTHDFTSIWGSPYEAFVGILHGILNLGHVIVSYISFKELPAGSAISLFYLYPIINIIIGAIAFNETFPIHTILLLGIALVGTYLIASSNLDKNDTSKHKKTITGIIMAILAAITESIIFFFVRSNTDASKSPFYTVNHLYPAGLAILLIYGIKSHKNLLDMDLKVWSKLLGFNALLGFTGYIARFYSIPKVSTLIFSMLSFVGVISAYIWGSIFADEKITSKGITGGLMIASTIAILRYLHMF